MTAAEIIDVIEGRLELAAQQCNSTWFDHNDGVIRGLLWAMTGKDPGTRLLSRVRDIYRAMGARIKEADGHFHYALPGRPDSDLDECALCSAQEKP